MPLHLTRIFMYCLLKHVHQMNITYSGQILKFFQIILLFHIRGWLIILYLQCLLLTETNYQILIRKHYFQIYINSLVIIIRGSLIIALLVRKLT